MNDFTRTIKQLLDDIAVFSRHACGLTLRDYQSEVARSVIESVCQGAGRAFVVIFPRQSGKNELQAQIEAYLLTLFSQTGGEIVKVSPTWKPQSQNAMRRLERVLQRNLITRHLWSKSSGYIYQIGAARMTFLSGAKGANVVGATASLLLECDEAQDVSIEKWDKEINPMAASTNATRVFWGTAWTADTLLGREKRYARQAEQRDGVRRVFEIDAEGVAQEVPAYARFVENEIARLGRQHPFVRTQYFSEELDAQSGMFPAERLALMRGEHAHISGPQSGRTYAFLIDVAGEAQPGELDGSAGKGAARQDASALTIVEVDFSTLEEAGLEAPRYLVRHRRLWQGETQVNLYAQIRALAEIWQPRRVVVDATGIGAGLSAFLSKALPGRVIPFTFSQKSKSDLGWRFLAIVETGRYKEYRGYDDALQALFFRQCAHCEMEILPGSNRTLRWGVPDNSREVESNQRVHDDLLVSAALCAALEGESWGQARSAVIQPPDPADPDQLRFEA